MKPRSKVIVGAVGGFLLGLVVAYFWSMYPRTGLGILLDDAYSQVQRGQTHEQVVEILGPEHGRLSDDLLLKNLNRRYVSFDPVKDFGIPNEEGGVNLIWLNKMDGRVFLVVSLGQDRRVRNSYAVEIRNFIE